MEKRINSTRWLALTLAIAMMFLFGTTSALAAPAEYTCYIWVEAPNVPGDPGDPTLEPEMAVNYVLYEELIYSAEAGSSVKPSQNMLGEYLRAANGRRFARFLSSDSAVVAADGGTVVNAYYTRAVFTYAFDLGNAQSEMTIGTDVFKGNGDMYTVEGKFQQEVAFPGIANGMLPISTNASMPNAKCVGWTVDERTGATGQALTHVQSISQSLLPTDDMPYDGLVYQLTGAWFNNPNLGMTACWFEELPDEAAEPDSDELQRMQYNGKTYVNYPATNFPFALPENTQPKAGEAAGLKIENTIPPVDPKEDNTWSYVYSREKYNVSFNTNGAAPIAAAKGLMFEQNLGDFDPGWNAGTTTVIGDVQYQFDGWFNQNDQFLGYTLTEAWMPAGDLALEAKWTKAE